MIPVSSIAFATDIPEATIHRVGIFSGSAIVQVSGSPLTVTTIFYLDPNNESKQLATLLTAFSLGKTVWMRTAAATSGSLVRVIYVNQ